MAAIAADDWIIAETPNLLEALPEILNARQPEPGEVIVGDYQTNDPLPPAVMEEPDVIIEAGIEIPDVMEDVLSPLEPIVIPSTNVLATVLVYFVIRSAWNARKRKR
jgi:3-hydroxyacyl-CoA dehydrogenase